jgi:hypothetical protein
MSTSSPIGVCPASPEIYWPDTTAERAGLFRVDGESMVGAGVAMQRLRTQLRRLGPHFRTVLLTGDEMPRSCDWCSVWQMGLCVVSDAGWVGSIGCAVHCKELF